MNYQDDQGNEVEPKSTRPDARAEEDEEEGQSAVVVVAVSVNAGTAASMPPDASVTLLM